jgi:arylsulfatase
MRYFLGMMLSACWFCLQGWSAPNVLLILVDDMGYSDLGCFGSEIETPNIDSLAAKGLIFTQFTNCAKCETTRTTLMSGRYNLEAKDGRGVITIPESLKLGGYQTFMIGKWHIFDSPTKRGFDKWYGLKAPYGMSNFFTAASGRGGPPYLVRDDKLTPVPENFYSTITWTDEAITYLKERDRAKPFFMYAAYTAPHYPLQAPKEDVMKYRGKYRDGWAALRQRRLAGLKAKHIVPADQELSPSSQADWESLSEESKDLEDLRMATYAAMIDIVDRQVGRLINTLKAEGVFEDTLILFLSDNGACPFDRTHKSTLEKNLMPWDPESFHCYNDSWANACNTPWKKFKQNQNEGGISTPLIAHWPNGIKHPGRFDRDRGHLVDIHATLRDLADVDYPVTFNGTTLGPARGLSLTKAFEDEPRPLHKELFYEFSNKYSALWTPKWKLVDNLYLYNISEDRIESKDVSKEYPEQFELMKTRWQELNKSLKN